MSQTFVYITREQYLYLYLRKGATFMFKKILALVMCLVLMCGTGLIANAETTENQVQPRYSYTNTISATLSNSSGKALCIGNVNGYNGTTTKIVLTVTLQKKTLFWWSKVQEWTTTANTYYATISKTVAVGSGTHRVKVNAVVYSGSKSEEITMYSKTYDF